MAPRTQKTFDCSVVGEVVQIALRRKRGLGFSGEDYPFVQCDQQDCQYVDENKPPCPLTLELFEEEIKAGEARARDRYSSRDD